MIRPLYIILLSSSLLLASCSLLEKKLLQSVEETTSPENFKLPEGFTKTLIVGGKLEKVEVSRVDDSLMFYKEIEDLYLLKTDKVLATELKSLGKDTLYAMGLEYDSISVVGNKTDAQLTYFYTKKNTLFSIEKVFFITRKKDKILSKNVKIKQKLVNKDSKIFEIDFSYAY